MSGFGLRGRGRPPLARRERGRASPVATLSHEAMILAGLAGEPVPPIPETLGPHGSEAGSIAAQPPPVQPAAPSAVRAPVQPPADHGYQRVEALLQRMLQQQQQRQVLPPAGAGAAGVQPLVQ